MKKIFVLILVFAALLSAGENSEGYLPGGLEIKAVRWLSEKPEISAMSEAEENPYLIDSPSVIGFVPYAAVTLTNERKQDLEYEAVKEHYVRGGPLISDPNQNYEVGVFDTGASSMVFGYEKRMNLGLDYYYMTSNYMTIGGIAGYVDTLVSKPIGVYIAGLGSIDEQTGDLSLDDMVGLSNFAVLAGEPPAQDEPDLPTVIGCPMAASWSVTIDMDTQISVEKNSRSYSGPKLEVFDYYDSEIPEYPNSIPLELRPLGAAMISYTPSLDGLGGDFSPSSPSVITGMSSQSLMFVSAVDMENNGNLAYDKDRFMFDTGAQATIVGNRVAARLGLDPMNPDFELYASGVTGDVIMLPGFVIDKITIPALGNWLEFTNVPVVVHDVPSPEGGTLDGIIGTNLFNDFNLVLNGGGIGFQDDPSIDFIPRDVPFVPADFAPENPDGAVDMADFDFFRNYWLTEYGQPGYVQKADLAPYPVPDDIVNMLDFAEFAAEWKEF
ncbi:retropepsin-like aspartic protease [Sedimentisphaera salicampi]|uniref:retropepsin-like aspartic protease n=1 Tax=Sedimentisphaera salicampi TaxID=1941349 RepID=UPI000B9A5854|nr:retropepsin-like aspartic protease [Sedimentisphaera salicampi]OXU15424.1 hypothetical protein SMSP1_00905 [Sedimentisphaera salicampi]